MRILVISASKHGSTEEIAAGLVLEFRSQGAEAEARHAGDPVDLASYDAVLLGSAIYAGHWMKEATAFVDAHAAELRAKPLWLFSSGPIGESKGGAPMPADAIAKLVERTGAREHKIFAGKLDPDDLSLAEKAITKVVRAPTGDFRDWEEIHAWARAIVADLGIPAPVTA